MVNPERADSIVSRSSKKKKNRKKRARQWTCYVENLKTTIDMMYEMCRSEQSVAGCREAILYLQSASNDFKSLIETINVEKEWVENQEPQKRQSVAWEVRKSMSSPNPVTITDKPLLPISSMIAEAVRNASASSSNTLPATNPTPTPSPLTYARITAAAAVAAVAVAAEQQDEGWQVVGNRRRKSTSSTTVSEFDREISIEKEQAPKVPLNVYERLSQSNPAYRRAGYRIPSLTGDSNRLTCPRSAMDLPQTKASMAKMAYSRQLLWEKNQQVLVEKLRAKQKKEKGKTCGFTFADPLAVRKSVEAFNQQKSRKSMDKECKSTSSQSGELQSINETNENDTSTDQPTCSTAVADQSDDVPADPTPSSGTDPDASQKATSRPQSLFGYVDVDGLENDVEWREMTEEEESLALEENSLKLEIQAISIDAELERQVVVEADKLEKDEKRERKMAKRASRKEDEEAAKKQEMENFYKMFEEIRNLATVAWSEIMENQTCPQNVHEPGTPVEKHEKMSSPSRRNRLKDDDDFGMKHEMKLKRADDLRQQLQEEKAAKVKELSNRVEEVRAKQAALKERKRKMLEERMQRAADNRDKNIMEVIRKAKDDDQRVNEIKFIATMQEDNKRYDLMMKENNMEEKQKQFTDERARKIEEKAAKKREQEAAAEARRTLAANSRLARIQQLTEQKEQRATQRAILEERKRKTRRDSDSNESTSSVPQDLMSALVDMLNDEKVKPGNWSWPSLDQTVSRKCTLCNVVTQSDFESSVHIFSKMHQDQAKTLTSGSMVEELKRHFYSIMTEVEKENVENDSDNDKERIVKAEEKMMNARKALEDMQINGPVPYPISSPRNRTKYVREFNVAFEKMINCRSMIDETTQNNVENTLTNVLSAVEEDSKNESSTNIDQLCAVGVIPKMCDSLLEWMSRGVSLRLCIRMCHAFCTFLKNVRVAYMIVFKPEMMKVMDRVVYLVQADPTNPQLSALLDVANTLLKCLSLRFESKSPRPLRELYTLDKNLEKVFEEVGSFMYSALSREEIQKALEMCKGSALISRLVKMAELVACRSDVLYLEYMDLVLKHTYSLRRSCEILPETAEKNVKSSKDLVTSTVHLVQNLKNEKIWRKLAADPTTILILVILCEDSMQRCLDSLKPYDVNRKWTNVTRNEEDMMEYSMFVRRIAEEFDAIQKRQLLISWTGHSSCLQILKDVPLRFFVVEKYSTKIIGTIEKMLEKLTNLEKSDMLGSFSSTYLDNSFKFGI